MKIPFCLAALSAFVLATGTYGRGHSPSVPTIGSPTSGQEIAVAESTVDLLRCRQLIFIAGDARAAQHTAR